MNESYNGIEFKLNLVEWSVSHIHGMTEPLCCGKRLINSH